jgi:hypothetical protein
MRDPNDIPVVKWMAIVFSAGVLGLMAFSIIYVALHELYWAVSHPVRVISFIFSAFIGLAVFFTLFKFGKYIEDRLKEGRGK